ncbi:hypothetical protein BUALT_Bualt08G0053000 [Buddleja alternifolia]|uniref:LNS2/PITP domain-containing protein n=1 Tax=Buddleja alternifolia TaxID=168488 RepID=A0AAV6X7X1_9LAMI|nr:hypothetical protein BUALT_Bualt08G0053000 [Buddleja alternifolia]
MQAVGKLGSYISRSVYTVSGPFHPFGGAVDIIVVEQPDGSFKSSPWYVRFGKFQGVLKTKEKVVSISVNGVEADFHMYLDHKGEAFFLKEVDGEEGGSMCSPPSSSSEDTDRQSGNRWSVKSKSCNNERNGNAVALTRKNSRRSQILGLVWGRRSMKEEGIKEEEMECGVIRTESLERAEIAADLLELKWSTNLASSRLRKDNKTSCFSSVDISKDEVNENLQVNGCCYDEMGRISHSNHQGVESTVEENDVEMKRSTSVCVVEKATSVECDQLGLAKSDSHVDSVTIVSEIAKSDSQMQDSLEKVNDFLDTSFFMKHSAADNMESFYNSEASESIVAESHSQSVPFHTSNDSFKGVDSQSVLTISSSTDSNCSYVEEKNIVGQDEIKMNGRSSMGPLCDPRIIIASRISEEEQLLFGDMDDFGSIDAKIKEIIHDDNEADTLFSSRVADGVNESGQEKCCLGFSLDQSVINDYINDDSLQRRRLRTTSSDVCNNKTGNVKSKELTRMVRSLPIMEPLSNNIEASDLGHFSDPLLYPGVKPSANNIDQSPGAQTMAEYVKMSKKSKDAPDNPSIGDSPRSVDSLRASGRIWPFSYRKSRSMKVSHADMSGSENPNEVKKVNNTCDLEGEKDVTKVKLNKTNVKILTPTSEQVASLDLKEGKNTVIFTFSTAMLGNQQVEAQIFLWRWDTRIVISDVDGTITRSDLLGQVMPLVGMDWSQTGVAHLFSAIKENGYHLLFLSARSISQSFHTRRFLFNIKQDGKALPEGPVVISPDGLFPSLFREVVRRAPHEFKIACLEDIRALFPADRNPFYAGFGNRDTDEFSYLKVGIPRGKIFIINPKGEIVVNHGVNTKSYLSLHTLVHGMFPTMSSSEKEDFNSWNYWKLPPPLIDL